jgi:hypothetical protein
MNPRPKMVKHQSVSCVKKSDAQKKTTTEESETKLPSSDIMGLKIPKKKQSSPLRSTDASPASAGGKYPIVDKKQLLAPGSSPVVPPAPINTSPVVSSPFSRGMPFNAPPSATSPMYHSPTVLSPTFPQSLQQPVLQRSGLIMKPPPELPVPPNQSPKEVLLAWSHSNLSANQIPTFELQKHSVEGYIVSVNLPHLNTNIHNKLFSPTLQAAEDQAAVRAMEHLWRLYHKNQQSQQSTQLQHPPPQQQHYGQYPQTLLPPSRNPMIPGMNNSPMGMPQPYPAFGMQPPPPHPMMPPHMMHPQPPPMNRPPIPESNKPPGYMPYSNSAYPYLSGRDNRQY